MEGNLVSFLEYLEHPRIHSITFPGSPEEGQPCSDFVVLRAGLFID